MDIIGTPAIIKGTAAAAVVRQDFVNPFSGRKAFAKELTVRNTGGVNPLLVYIPGSTGSLTVAFGTETKIDGPIAWVAFSSVAGSTWEVIAKVA